VEFLFGVKLTENRFMITQLENKFCFIFVWLFFRAKYNYIYFALVTNKSNIN